MRFWWNIIREQETDIAELTERLEQAVNKIEELQETAENLNKHNENLLKSIGNISTDIFNFKNRQNRSLHRSSLMINEISFSY